MPFGRSALTNGCTRLRPPGVRGDAFTNKQSDFIGKGDSVWALIHSDDAASAFVTAAEQPRNGVWHIVDNEPVSVRDLLEEFASRLGAPRPHHVPAWLAKSMAGEQAVSYFTASTRTTNARFRRDFGWAPRYPSYREGLDQIVAAWKEEAGEATAGMSTK